MRRFFVLVRVQMGGRSKPLPYDIVYRDRSFVRRFFVSVRLQMGGRSKPLPYDGVYLNRLSVRRFFCFGSRADGREEQAPPLR